MIDQAQLESLTVSEKLQLVTNLWNQIAHSNQPICVPDAVLNDAEHRVDEMLSDPSSGLTEEETISLWLKLKS
jgi:putative addiction module component (TIGR02574 family)